MVVKAKPCWEWVQLTIKTTTLNMNISRTGDGHVFMENFKNKLSFLKVQLLEDSTDPFCLASHIM